MKRLHKFLSLTPSEYQLLFGTFILLGLIRLGLRSLSFQTLRQLLAKLSQVMLKPQEAQQSCVPTPDKIVWAVNVSSRYMPGGVKCLARALTAEVLLSRCGYSPELRIGVAKGEEGQFEAHAWVETQGQVAIGYLRDLSRFTPLPALGGGKL